MKSNNSVTDSSKPCDLCGGGTYTFDSGSVWCPAERNDIKGHAGGHFVVRVAFERPPNGKTVDKSTWSNQPPKRQPLAPVERRASAPTSKPVVVKADDGFDTGFDGFVKGGE